MTDWKLLTLLFIISCIVVVTIIYPLRLKKSLNLLLFSLLTISIFSLYFIFGGWNKLSKHLEQQVRHKQAQELLTKFKDTNEIAQRLRASLKEDASSAQGWFLLGKLYKGQGELEKALEVLAKAYEYSPDNVEYLVNYIETYWQINNKTVLPEPLVTALNNVLKINPQEPDCLSLLAINAYNDKQYEQAISYWNRLLKLVPVDSREAEYLRKAISQAQKMGVMS